ncbi:6925_t:CDS:2 [Gigaspora margarita]|uniref:6925_t:CDS:1 n=1 Tax=Gigaspora margarita TaxID=4874 RepID=A0ABM8W383_GIGMA|nr:6925_t:CDS:2 [Gigaspora margarita]
MNKVTDIDKCEPSTDIIYAFIILNKQPIESSSTNRFNFPSIEINGEGSSKRKNKDSQNINTSNNSTSSFFLSVTNQFNGFINGIKALAPLSLSTNKNNGYTNELALPFNEQSYKTVPLQIDNNKPSLISRQKASSLDAITTPKSLFT